MAIFTAIAAFITTSAWFTGLSVFGAAVVQIGLGFVVNKLATSLYGKKPSSPTFGISGTISRGADVPQSFIVGTYATAGSMVWGEEWGSSNEYLTLAIELSNLPVRGLAGIFIDGEKLRLNQLKFI